LLRDDSLRETVNGGMLSGGIATLNRPAKFGFFLSEKLGDAGRSPFQAPLRLRGEAWCEGGRPYSYAVMAWCGGGRPSRRPYSCAVGAWIGGVVRFQFAVAPRSGSLTALETLETLTTLSEN